MTGVLADWVKAEIAFTAYNVAPTWTDVTTRLAACRSDKGQQYDYDGPQPGSTEATFDNSDGALDPNNTASIYYPNVKLKRQVRISVRSSVGNSVTDTFNRGDATVLGTASDGGAWSYYDLIAKTTLSPSPYGITSNRAYCHAGLSTTALALRDTGSLAADVSLTVYTTSYYRISIAFAVNPTTGDGYLYFPWGSTKCLARYRASVVTYLGTSDGEPPSGTVLRCTYDGVNTIKVYWDGVLKQTIVDASPLVAAGSTMVGLSASQNKTATGEDWDNFSAVVPGAAWTPISHGYVDSWKRSWPGGARLSDTVASCTDLTEFYARWSLAGVTQTQASAAQHMIAISSATCPAPAGGLTVAASGYTGNQWDYITNLAQSDGGLFYIDGNGYPVYLTSTYLNSSTRSATSQATFAFGLASGTEMTDEFSPELDDRLLANQITVVSSDGVSHPASDSASVAEYGSLPFSIDTRGPGGTGLIGSSANTRAAVLRSRRARPSTRIQSLTIDAVTGSTQRALAVTLQMGDRVTVAVQGLGDGAGGSQDYLITGIAHDIDVRGSKWDVTYQVEPVGAFSEAVDPPLTSPVRVTGMAAQPLIANSPDTRVTGMAAQALITGGG